MQGENFKLPIYQSYTYVSFLTSVTTTRKPTGKRKVEQILPGRLSKWPTVQSVQGINFTMLSSCGPNLRPALQQAILCMELVENNFKMSNAACYFLTPYLSLQTGIFFVCLRKRNLIYRKKYKCFCLDNYENILNSQ